MSGARLPGIEKLREHRERADRPSEPEPGAAPAASGRAARESDLDRSGAPAAPDEMPKRRNSVSDRRVAGVRATREPVDDPGLRPDDGGEGAGLAVPSGTGVHMHARVSVDVLDELEQRLDSLGLIARDGRVSKRNLLAALLHDLCRAERADDLQHVLEAYRASGETRTEGRHRVSTEITPTLHRELRASLRRLRRNVGGRVTQVELLSALVWHATRRLTQAQLAERYLRRRAV
jgi:hypothetical protein